LERKFYRITPTNNDVGVGGWMTTVGSWYENLRKPWWNPQLDLRTGVDGDPGACGLVRGLAWTNASGGSARLLILMLFGINIVLHML
jgi:hypothetical protein